MVLVQATLPCHAAVETNFLQLARRYWWLLMFGALLGALAARYAASQMTPTYEGVVAVLAGPIDADYDTQRAAGNLARTYAGLATSGPVLERTLKAANASIPLIELRDNVSATSNDVTRIVRIRVKDSQPTRAADIANALARQLIRLGVTKNSARIARLMKTSAIAGLAPAPREEVRVAATQLFGESTAGRLKVVDPAVPLEEPIAPRVSLITLMGLFGGLLAAALVIVLRGSIAKGFESEDELLVPDGTRSLGAVPAGRFRLIDPATPSRLARDYRMLGAKINFSANGRPIRSVLVTGADDGVGSGAVAANIAAAQASGHTRVTLLDASGAKGEITRLLNLEGQLGYADFFGGGRTDADTDAAPGADDVAWTETAHAEEPIEIEPYRLAQTNTLMVMPSGSKNGPTVIDTEGAQRLIARLQEDTDLVVINAPPADRESSTLIWARVADATIVVIRRRKTPRERIRRVLNSLSVADANVIGTVFKR